MKWAVAHLPPPGCANECAHILHELISTSTFTSVSVLTERQTDWRPVNWVCYSSTRLLELT